MTNLPMTPSTLTQQIGELSEKLTPVTDEHVLKSIRSMLAVGLVLPYSIDAGRFEDMYKYALSGVPAYGLHRATQKIIRGEYDINKGFIPLPPELAAMSRAEARVIREDKTRLMERLSQINEAEARPVKRDKEMIGRIRLLLAEARRYHAKHKVGSEFFHEPMSAEQSDYFKRIMDLRDAPGISAEQAAYRRKISSEIGSADKERQDAE